MSETHNYKITNKSAAESAYGFMRQLDRMFQWLMINAKDSDTVLFEVLDDVAIHSDNGQIMVEQDKAFVSDSSNPLRNRSVALWKTINNWIEECVSGRLDVQNTTFLLWVSNRSKPGEWAESFFSATSASDVEKVIANVRYEIQSASKIDSKEGVYLHINNVLRLYTNHKETVENVIIKTQVECGSGSANSELEASFKQRYDIFSSFIPDIIAHGKAELDSIIKTNIEQRQLVCIKVREFKKEITRVISKLRTSKILPSIKKPSKDEIEREIDSTPLYLKQLNLIEECNNELIDAATVYLRSSTYRTACADSSYFSEENWSDLSDEIMSFYRTNVSKSNLNSTWKNLEKGKYIYNSCKEACQKHNANHHNWFLRGCLHTLANIPSIGWHPDYLLLLKITEDIK